MIYLIWKLTCAFVVTIGTEKIGYIRDVLFCAAVLGDGFFGSIGSSASSFSQLSVQLKVAVKSEAGFWGGNKEITSPCRPCYSWDPSTDTEKGHGFILSIYSLKLLLFSSVRWILFYSSSFCIHSCFLRK